MLAVEDALPIPLERPEPDVLSGLVVELIAVVAPSSLGGPDVSPTRSPVDSAGVARGLDEGLDEHGRGAVALGPVPGQAAAHDGQYVRFEVGDLDPGLDTTESDILLRFRFDWYQLIDSKKKRVFGREFTMGRPSGSQVPATAKRALVESVSTRLLEGLCRAALWGYQENASSV